MTIVEARRVVASISDYLRYRDESPLGAVDLVEAVAVIERHAHHGQGNVVPDEWLDSYIDGEVIA